MWKPTLLLLLTFAASAQQSPQALVQDAITRQKAGDLEGAVKEYREFLKIDPKAIPIRTNLGAALAGLGRFDEAIVEYKKVLKDAPTSTSTRLNLALAYYKMGGIADAATELAKVHHEAPANEQASLLLSDCYLRMDQNKDVISVLEPLEKTD